jgi:hypothetical protein
MWQPQTRPHQGVGPDVVGHVAALSLVLVTRIGTQGTTPHRLKRPKEGSATTWPTIRKILEDHGVLPKAYIIISIKVHVK